FVERVAGKPPGEVAARAIKLMNISAPVERGGMPNRIHVIEDYETDIERRWWLCGKMETKNVPSDSKRACRGVFTNDFDDLIGDPQGRPEGDVHGSHLHSGSGPADGQKHATEFPLLAEGYGQAARADLQSEQGLSSAFDIDRLAPGKVAIGSRGHDRRPPS